MGYYLKIIGLISLIALLVYLFIKSYKSQKEFEHFVEFHKNATETISLGMKNEDYPFFKDDRLNTLENNIKTLEKYINNEKSQIVEDKHNLQTIISDISHQVKTP